jgi:hypothetical protein
MSLSLKGVSDKTCSVYETRSTIVSVSAPSELYEARTEKFWTAAKDRRISNIKPVSSLRSCVVRRFLSLGKYSSEKKKVDIVATTLGRKIKPAMT